MELAWPSSFFPGCIGLIGSIGSPFEDELSKQVAAAIHRQCDVRNRCSPSTIIPAPTARANKISVVIQQTQCHAGKELSPYGSAKAIYRVSENVQKPNIRVKRPNDKGWSPGPGNDADRRRKGRLLGSEFRFELLLSLLYSEARFLGPVTKTHVASKGYWIGTILAHTPTAPSTRCKGGTWLPKRTSRVVQMPSYVRCCQWTWTLASWKDSSLLAYRSWRERHAGWRLTRKIPTTFCKRACSLRFCI